jgi:probable addiction module antidote protein
MPGGRHFDAARYRDDPKAIAGYLNEALSTKDPYLVTRAIGTMVRCQGMTRFSRKAGMPRDSLYRAFTSDDSPAFDTMLRLLMALNIELIAKPAVVEPKPQANP